MAARSCMRPLARMTAARAMALPCSLPGSQIRHSSYSAPAPDVKQRKRVTIQTLQNLYRKAEPITMLTAHDFPSAHVADTSGMDVILVGDSLGMVALGLDDTSQVVLEEMVLHCRSVARAAKSSFIVRSTSFASAIPRLTIVFPGRRHADGLV